MMALAIHGATHRFGAPEGHDPVTDPHIYALMVRVTEEAGFTKCESAWEPTPAELASLLAGGRVILTVLGGQVPVNLRVEASP